MFTCVLVARVLLGARLLVARVSRECGGTTIRHAGLAVLKSRLPATRRDVTVT